MIVAPCLSHAVDKCAMDKPVKLNDMPLEKRIEMALAAEQASVAAGQPL